MRGDHVRQGRERKLDGEACLESAARVVAKLVADTADRYPTGGASDAHPLRQICGVDRSSDRRRVAVVEQHPHGQRRATGRLDDLLRAVRIRARKVVVRTRREQRALVAGSDRPGVPAGKVLDVTCRTREDSRACDPSATRKRRGHTRHRAGNTHVARDNLVDPLMPKRELAGDEALAERRERASRIDIELAGNCACTLQLPGADILARNSRAADRGGDRQ